jgi:tetratricopeptide (TPR) repeat protein
MPGTDRDVQGWLLSLWPLESNYQAILDFVSSASEPRAWHFMWTAKAYHFMGEPELAHASYDSARAMAERELEAHPDDWWYHGALGRAYAGLGRKQEAIREGKRGVELLPVSKDAMTGVDPVWVRVTIHAMVGEYDAALDRIEYVLSIPSTMSVPWLRLDPDYDPLRDHPRFQALLDKYSGE